MDSTMGPLFHSQLLRWFRIDRVTSPLRSPTLRLPTGGLKYFAKPHPQAAPESTVVDDSIVPVNTIYATLVAVVVFWCRCRLNSTAGLSVSLHKKQSNQAQGTKMAIKNFSFPLFFFLISVVSHLPGVASLPPAPPRQQTHRFRPHRRWTLKISLPGGRCLKKDCTAHSVLFDVADSTFRPLTLLTDNLGSAGALLPNGSSCRPAGSMTANWPSAPSTPLFAHSCRGRLGGATFNPLAAGRSYASDQILPDGRVLVLGGLRQLSYEFFPRQENSSAVHFDFLGGKSDRESMGEESLLYPFLHLLPDGTLFVFANNHVAILDVSSVASSAASHRFPMAFARSYPSSGSSVLLRLSLPS
ncbi:hypothetical protein HPP92_011636 [Vanilla planifolia]|uniref:Glyoxal oxidase N-terminal domain-containing protein n=1 Tax=Vanilla planifolia TaxID=51239 RepID=A0A835RCR2_VANPL|nr:hypothetical protein HPP92_011636 [Vanilla planifolia]